MDCGLTNELFRLGEHIETRWASPENPSGAKGRGGRIGHGRKGMAYFVIRPGRSIVLARENNRSGIIHRIWMTFHDLSPLMLRQLRISFYWDGAARPAVDVPVGDFFGMALGRKVAFSGELFSSPEGRSFVCTVPMPFRKSMRVEIHNDGISTAAMFYYDIDYTLGDEIAEDAGYFHAWYNQENPTTLLKDYTVLDTLKGRGRFLGASFGVRMNRDLYGSSWGGEGEIKFYLDGDTDFPTLCGTGTEDYVGTGWCQGVYSHPSQGFTVADSEQLLLAFYRFHVQDPVYFQSGIRVTIQQIGSWTNELKKLFCGRGQNVLQAGILAADPPEAVDFSRQDLPDFDLFERSDSWNSCCWFYLDSSEHDLRGLPSFAERAAALPGFDPKELQMIKNDIGPMIILRKYLKDFDSMELPQLQELSATLSGVVGFLSMQEESLAENGKGITEQ